MRTIKIGRSASNDLVLSNPKVSGNHATLVVQDNEMSATLKDLNSTNGTYVNGRRITGETVVRPTDVLRFGNEETSLQRILAQMAAPVAPVGGDKTVIPANAGGGQRYTIGRAADNQIVMPQSDVSGHHAVLSRDGQGNVILQDLNSTNGTFVNGQRITGQKMLNAGDRVTLTSNGYPLDWQNYVGAPIAAAGGGTMVSGMPPAVGGAMPPAGGMPPASPAAPAPAPKKKSNTALWVILGLLALAAIGAGLFFGLKGCDTTGNSSESSVVTDTTTPPPAGPTAMTATEINDKYKDAVCMIIGQWGVNVYANTEEGKVLITSLQGGQYSGTAFCISEDGVKYATNLHCVRAWVFSPDEMNNLQVQANSYVRSVNPGYDAILEGVAKLYILPNGKPLSLDNATEVQEFKVPNLDGVENPVLNKDVAVVQTITRERPSGINGWIDPMAVTDAAPFYTPGKDIHSIGYPAGVTLAQNSNQEMVNQLHSGKTTQDKGEFQFGVDFASTGGASGSPVLNENGQLIGVFNSGYGGVGNLNYAVKLKHLQDLLRE